MKLTATQLRRIIKEEVSKVLSESALHRRTPYQHYLDAMLNAVYDGDGRYQRKLDAMAYSIYEDWKAAFTNSDPSMGPAGKEVWIDQCDLALNSMDEQIDNAMRHSDALLIDEARNNIESIIDDVEEKLFNGEFAKADVGIDLDSLNTKLDTEEQKEFLENLLAMNSDQLASQYSDISKEMNGRRSMVSPGTPDKEIIKMILDTAYPELDLYEDKVTLKEGHSRITQEELRAWKIGNLEFVSEVGSMSTGMRRKVDPDFHLKAALKRVPSFKGVDVDMLQWFQDMLDSESSKRLLSDFNRDWDIPGVTLEDIKNIQLAMKKDYKRLDKRSSYELG